MEILGIMLGMTMTLLIVALIYGAHELDRLQDLNDLKSMDIEALYGRIEALEKRKRFTEGPPGVAGKMDMDGGEIGLGHAQPLKQPRKGIRMRAWNEDIGAVESK